MAVMKAHAMTQKDGSIASPKKNKVMKSGFGMLGMIHD